MIIGVDASTVATGFAFGGPGDGAPRGGVWKLPGPDELVFDRTLGSAHDMLFMYCRNLKAEHVAIEAPLLLVDAHHSAHTAMSLIQLTGALRAAAHRAGCKVHLISVQSARSYFIGTARLKRKEAKQAVMDRCKLLGWPFLDDNQADANAVWALAMARVFPKWAPQTGPLFAASGGGR